MEPSFIFSLWSRQESDDTARKQHPAHIVLVAGGFGMSTQLEVSPSSLWADFGVSCVGSSAASAWELGVRLELDLQSVYRVSSGLVLNIGKW